MSGRRNATQNTHPRFRATAAKRVRHIAVLDWDGSLHGRDTMPAFLAFLEARGRVAPNALQEFHALDQAHGDGRISRFEMTIGHTQLFADALAGLHRSELEAHADAFLAAGDDAHVFSFTRSFLRTLRLLKIEPVLISGAPEVVLRRHAELLGIADARVHALTLRYDEAGFVTNELPVPTADAETKHQIVRTYERRGAKVLLGLGNSSSDLPLLVAAEVPVYVGDALPPGAPSDTVLICEQGSNVDRAMQRVATMARSSVARGLAAIWGRALK